MGSYLSKECDEQGELRALCLQHNMTTDLLEPMEHGTCVVNVATSLPPVYKESTGDLQSGDTVARAMMFAVLGTSGDRVHVLPRPFKAPYPHWSGPGEWPGDWGEGRWIPKDALLEFGAPRFDVEAVKEAIAKGLHRHGMYSCFYAVDDAGAKTLVVLRGLTFKIPTNKEATRRVPVWDTNDNRYLELEATGHKVQLKKNFSKCTCTGTFYKVPIGAPLPPVDAVPRTKLTVAGDPRVVFAGPSHTSLIVGHIAVNDTYEVFGDIIPGSFHKNEQVPWLCVRFRPMHAANEGEQRFGFTLALELSDEQKRILREAGYDIGGPREAHYSDEWKVPLEAAATHDAEDHKKLCELLNWHGLLPRMLLAGPAVAAIPLVHAVSVDLALAYPDSTGNDSVLTTDMGACFEVMEKWDGRLRVRPRCDGAAWPRDLWVPASAMLEIDAPRFDPDAVREAIALGLHTLGMYSCYYVLEDTETKTLVVLLGPTLARSTSTLVSRRIPVFHNTEQVKAKVVVLPLLERQTEMRRSSAYNLQSRCLTQQEPVIVNDDGSIDTQDKLKVLTGWPCSLPLRAPVDGDKEWHGVALKGNTMYGVQWVLYAAPSHTAEMVGVVPCDAEFEVGAVVDAAKPFAVGGEAMHSMLWLRARVWEWYDPTEAPRSQLKKRMSGMLEGFVLAQGIPDDKLAELREKGVWQKHYTGGSNWGVGGN